MKGRTLTESFYFLSKLEDEGLGTTYEYLVKWNLIHKLISNKKIRNILIFGLPEKYGLSLDFIFLGCYKKCNVVILDDREKKMRKLKRAFSSLESAYDINSEIEIKSILSFNSIKFKKKFDLLLSAEVLQRFGYDDRLNYLKCAKSLARQCILFIPNAENKMHKKISNLRSLSLVEVLSYLKKYRIKVRDSGYIDIPPFPPGLKQKKKNHTYVNATLLKVLDKWVFVERFIPIELKKRFAHMIYISI